TPDLTFGNTGMVVTDYGFFNEASSVAIQPDGKILVGGYANVAGSEDFSVIRYNSNGSIDTAFGTGGIATVGFNSSTSHSHEVLLQPDGKIVLAGFAFLGSGNADVAIARFLTNGDLDTSFAVQGKTTTNISGYNDYGFGAALQPDGKILVVGSAEIGVGGDICIVRYNTDGSLDQSFDGDGILNADIGGSYDVAFSIAVQSDGKIVTAGYSAAGNSYDFSVARFNDDGSFDTNFGTGGKTVTPVGPSEDICLDMAIQPDGKIVLVGYMWNATTTDTDYGVVRYNTNGTIDNTFGTNGKATGPISNTYDYLRGVTIQPNGKIVAVGQTSTPGFTDLAVLRLTPAGIPDSTFNGTGIIIADVGGDQDYLMTATLQPDQKIVVVGATLVPAVSDVDVVVARYLGDMEMGVVDFATWNHSVFIYPNPVSENTTLQYTLAAPEEISIKVYDAQGKLVSVLIDHKTQQAGAHQQPLNLSPELAPGIYFVELSSVTGTVSVRIIK
ncbi:MAG TPA: T9SS type A sorting domain-containing protein, partial [Bacteroidia bacterium]|nr:T9SS type A sorting domain-containing protein [Bacteroidia bacterium]